MWSEFYDHTLDNSEVSIQNTVQEAAIVLRYNILLMISNFLRQERKRKSIPGSDINISICINARDKAGFIPLHAHDGHVVVTRLLVDRGADVNALSATDGRSLDCGASRASRHCKVAGRLWRKC